MKNNKINLSFPRFVVGNLPLSRLLLKEEQQPCFNKKVEDPRQKPSGMTLCFMGFTLIELLVVVLIIGILAAVAVPQYQKAVWKSRNAQLKQLVKTVAQAEEAYYMANGKYAANFDELSVDFPLTAVTTSATGHYGTCGTNTRGTDSVRQGKNFYVVLNSTDADMTQMAVVAYYDAAPYKCAGFGYNFYSELEGIGLHCREMIDTNRYSAGTGSFCEKIERGELVYQSDSWRWYSLP